MLSLFSCNLSKYKLLNLYVSTFVTKSISLIFLNSSESVISSKNHHLNQLIQIPYLITELLLELELCFSSCSENRDRVC